MMKVPHPPRLVMISAVFCSALLLTSVDAVTAQDADDLIVQPAVENLPNILPQAEVRLQPWLGVGLDPDDKDLDDGIPVLKVYSGSPAKLSGIEVGDKLMGTAVIPWRVPGDLRKTFLEMGPGDEVELQLDRAGKTVTTTVVLSVRPVSLSPLLPETATVVPSSMELSSNPGPPVPVAPLTEPDPESKPIPVDTPDPLPLAPAPTIPDADPVPEIDPTPTPDPAPVIEPPQIEDESR